MKKSYLFLLIILLNISQSFALGAGNLCVPQGLITYSDTALNANDKPKCMDLSDSLLFFPAHDTYSEWDTLSIHPGRYDFCNIDSVNILLNDLRYCGYVHPFDGNKSSDFGYRRGRGHYGVDINLETGDPVAAAFEGKVRISVRNKSYGNVVVIRHNNGLETFYAHLSKLKVVPGQWVDAGQIIGLGGNTGHSYGSHLHFEVRYRGIPLNPNYFISFDTKKLIADTYTITQGDFDYLSDTKAKKASTKKSNRYRAVPGPKRTTYEPLPLTASTATAAVEVPVKITPPAVNKTSTVKKVPAKSGSRTYVVKKGDTLYKIAKIYGTTTANICKLNGITPTTTLSIGRKLKI